VVAQVLEVLLDNAQRHGRGEVSVVAREAPNDSVAIDVSDEGPGIDGDIEDVFARRAGSDEGNGHGIGLHLARSLAMAEDGRVVVTRAGSGPVFTLFLRRSRGDEDV
jgi:signal transduction histidine kinase